MIFTNKSLNFNIIKTLYKKNKKKKEIRILLDLLKQLYNCHCQVHVIESVNFTNVHL